MAKQLYDLTRVLDSNSQVFPGDPVFTTQNIHNVAMGDNYSLQHLHFCNHSGTHIDFPAHILKNSKSSLDYSISELTGPGLIIECPKQLNGKVNQELINQHSIMAHDIVFFKNTTYLDTSTAQLLVKKKVKIVGIDSISIDDMDSINLPVHHQLLKNNILIVESLDLSHVPVGRGEILIAPLKINSDGAPARVLMWQ